MLPMVLDWTPTISDQDVLAFEKEIGFVLPSDYRTWLLATNGGRCRDNVKTSNENNIEYWYSLNTVFSWSGLRNQWRFLLDLGHIAPHDLPIAHDKYGGEVSLRLTDEDYGKVVFYVSEPGVDEWGDVDEESDGTVPAAESFSELLSGITVEVDPNEDVPGHPAFQAIHRADMESLGRMLSANECDVNLRDDRGWTLLMYATHRPRTEAMELLLARGASLEATDDDGETALFYAVYPAWISGFDVLGAANARLDVINKKGNTAFMEAISGRYTGSAIKLIEMGADIHYRSPKGDTALSLCKENTYEYEYVRPRLLEAGAKE